MGIVHVADNVALDFVGTMVGRGTVDHEELVSPDVLAQWYVDAGLVDEPPIVTARQLSKARRLREQLHALVVSLITASELDPSIVSAVNRIARRPGPVAALDNAGHCHREGDAHACLAAVARAAVDLFDRNDAVVKLCGDPDCSHPFLDRSRSKGRRWCDMATCGDRNKQRAYRARTTGDIVR